jgi:hypothetical protein
VLGQSPEFFLTILFSGLILVGMIRRLVVRRFNGICRVISVVLLAPSLAISLCQSGQASTPTDTGQAQPSKLATDPISELVQRLSPPQKVQFSNAIQAFREQRYPEAFAIFKQLLSQVPGDATLSKFATEAALNSGDTAFALKTIRPLAAMRPDDFQAANLLARACAESGDTSCRDAAMERMADLHRRGLTPPKMKDYVVERLKIGDNTLVIYNSFEPWGHYKVYNYGQVTDAQGKLFLGISIESNDGDQPLFAQEHPKEAAAGLRQFSLDAYRETGLNSQNQRTQTHYTFEFLVGQPSYDKVREEFISVVKGTIKPISSRSGLVP